MTLIPRQEEKHCFIACSEDKVNAGLCDCINRMRNVALRQPPVVRQSEQFYCWESGEAGVENPLCEKQCDHCAKLYPKP